MRRFLLGLAAALALAIAATGCSSAAANEAVTGAAEDGAGAPAAAAGTAAAVDPPSTTGNGDGSGPGSGSGSGLTADELSARIVELDTALDVPFRDVPEPVAISIPAVGVNASPIDGVGVEPNGELEVPSAKRVGWYEYGPVPGQAGSSVLAAHIASGGVNGAFRHLSDADVGDRVEIVFADDSQQEYEIVEMAQYDKDELPFERVFAREGAPVITLITCGGTFQPSVGSYEDNIVAYAVPVGS